ncbi:MAG: hypothetical protein PVI91_04915 [Gammaproteobacteria bacterium]|jgi:poly(3-hydroxybutyrate) depolymerase
MKRTIKCWLRSLHLLVLIGLVPAGVAGSLQTYNISDDGISISGVSAGGYMAHQFHVAHSASVRGAGIIAGGPYHCAGDAYPFNMLTTMDKCMDAPDGVPFFGPPDVDASIAETQQEFRDGTIDDPANLRADGVYLFSGRLDRTVPQPVMDVLDVYYRRLGATVRYIHYMPAGHAMITDNDGANACNITEAPFINDCDHDAAGALLRQIYGPLKDPVPWEKSSLLSFDQSDFIEEPEANSMQSVGYLYVPEDCARELPCRLHIALHGCGQTEEAIGDAFYTQAGYNGWAEANDIIVLYPQAAARTYLLLPWPNPNGCWDWWGYTGGQYHTREGVQMRAIKAMVDRLSGAR